MNTKTRNNKSGSDTSKKQSPRKKDKTAKSRRKKFVKAQCSPLVKNSSEKRWKDSRIDQKIVR